MSDPENKPADYITVYRALFGWKAIHLWWNPELGGFWEPWQTGDFSYEKREDAVKDAKSWAEDEELEYKEPSA